ncbi:primosomal protein DnaI [Streptococcus gallinaceus]|uniref:primosomal protein DnaI n=1 Tax=Streptococcus gallinaceus TaxID=165758 RepID=UPI0020A03866|nr:primosomal protein DnaI [Streptococcus gallinaceus]MCP1639824.1 primosomal protein DnaI [Streptococcus gallinaceus]MCP1770606.1 primosomal protein DnaI [Streptococcus gallinaceus]
MNPVQENMKRENGGRKSFQELYAEIVSDAEVAEFIAQHQLTEDQVSRSLSKFFEYLNERKKYLAKDSAYIAVGYKPVLVMNEGYADVSYQETQALLDYRKAETIKNRIQLISLPASLKSVTAADLDFEDVNRMPIYEAISEFLERVGRDNKGLYVFGNFGIGKSYLMAYLAHQLSVRHELATTMLHYPTFVVDIKNAISSGSVKERIDDIKAAQVLILDDIGAEQHSSWVRDDVLQVILQYRMQENLPTFFTSNFSFADLERHFSSGKIGDETWQARRVMERIRYLAREIHLEGSNRRHD